MRKPRRILTALLFAVLAAGFCLSCGAPDTDRADDSSRYDVTQETPVDPQAPSDSGDDADSDVTDPEDSDPGDEPTPPTETHKHVLQYFAPKDPDCENNGNVEYWYCAECETSFSDSGAAQTISETTLPGTGHDYTETVIAPTCTTDGYTVYKCRYCGDEYTDGETEATGHDYMETIVPPTCVTEGYTLHRCSRCGDEYTSDIISVTEHSFGQEITVKAPTCTESGQAERVCGVCGKKETRTLPATEHSYVETVVQPTCTENGYTKHVCKDCDDEYSDNETDALGHKYKATVTAPTCITDGYTTHECVRCGNTYTDSYIQATGHTYSDEWTADDVYHWHALTCGCGTEPTKLPHNDVNGKCVDCGKALWSYKLTIENDVVIGIVIAEGVTDVDVIIPEGVTEIGDSAFEEVKAIKSVYIPKSVTCIGKRAFLNSGIKTAEFEIKDGWFTAASKTSKSGPSAFSKIDKPVTVADKLTASTNKNYYWLLKS